jgi:purine-binding chemotaxis protein CheW
VTEGTDARTTPEAIQRVLEARAKTLARPLDLEEAPDTVELIVMALGQERYGVDTQHVREVLVLADLAPVPGSAPFWAGIINVRGTLYPVLDLRRYLGLPDGPARDGPSIVVLISAGGLTIGLAADDAPEVRSVPAGAIRSPLAGASRAAHVVAQGITDDLLTVLDAGLLLEDPALVAREEHP